MPARWRWRLGTLAVLALVVVLVVRGANRPDDPELAPPPTEQVDEADEGNEGEGAGGSGASGRSPLLGFEEVAFRIEVPGAEASTWCALLADEVAERQQGLSDQDDLRGYDGMVFRYGEPSTIRFTMRDTRIPLSIAFFDGDGAFLSAEDMEPCPPGTADCPTYGTDQPFVHALEVPLGDLPSLGVADGAVLTFPDEACPPG